MMVEELAGESVYSLKGSLSGQAVLDLIDDPELKGQLQSGTMDVEYLIGVEDFILLKGIAVLRLTAQDPLTGVVNMFKTEVVMTLSDFGKAVDIQAPEDLEEDTPDPELEIGVPPGEDDHSNDPDSPTRISVGETVEGSIDNIFDVDFFVFQAEEGQGYQIDVALVTLPDSVVTLYNSDREELALNDDYGDTLASRIIWTAPTSGDYFLAVENADGNTGAYTLTITQVTTQP